MTRNAFARAFAWGAALAMILCLTAVAQQTNDAHHLFYFLRCSHSNHAYGFGFRPWHAARKNRHGSKRRNCRSSCRLSHGTLRLSCRLCWPPWNRTRAQSLSHAPPFRPYSLFRAAWPRPSRQNRACCCHHRCFLLKSYAPPIKRLECSLVPQRHRGYDTSGLPYLRIIKQKIWAHPKVKKSADLYGDPHSSEESINSHKPGMGLKLLVIQRGSEFGKAWP